MKVGLPFPRYEGEKRQVFLREMNARLASLPGVRAATVGLDLPVLGSSWSSVFIVGDQPVPERADLPVSLFTPIAPGYIETFGIPLFEGRTFEGSDGADAPKVVVVNRKLAERFWPGESAIGKRLKQGWPEDSGDWSPWREIVGVVADTKQEGLAEETALQTFIPMDQSLLWDVEVALRTEGDPMALSDAAKSAIAAMDRDVPVYEVETMDRVMASSIAPRRFTMILLGLFAALALGLAAIGLYGVVAYSVAGRTREIGLRMSVGAARRDIFRLVVRQGMGCALAGAAIGLAAATGASQLLSSFLHGVAPRDPLTFAVVPLALLAVAFGASAAPALQASRIDPIRALRHD
jgi:putative ABC transport system permease protein